MDCRTQEEVDGWIFRDLVDYFEDDDRLYQSRKCQKTPDRVLNQISLEFSHTPMKNQIESPLFVRQLDWIDNVWPAHLRMAGHYPSVQKYCLTSTCGKIFCVVSLVVYLFIVYIFECTVLFTHIIAIV